MKKSSKVIIVLLIITLIAVLAFGGYAIYQLNDKLLKQEERITELSKKENSSIETTNNLEENKTTSDSKREITSDEIEELESLFNSEEANGFVVSRNIYTKPSEINLEEVFYCGAGFNNEVTSEEIQEYKKIEEYMYTDMIKITTDQAQEIYELYTGEELTNLSVRLSYWIYLEEYDAYYAETGDSNRENVTCEGGTVNENDMVYTVELSNGNTVTVQKVKSEEKDEGYVYIFKSNVAK